LIESFSSYSPHNQLHYILKPIIVPVTITRDHDHFANLFSQLFLDDAWEKFLFAYRKVATWCFYFFSNSSRVDEGLFMFVLEFELQDSEKEQLLNIMEHTRCGCVCCRCSRSRCCYACTLRVYDKLYVCQGIHSSYRTKLTTLVLDDELFRDGQLRPRLSLRHQNMLFFSLFLFQWISIGFQVATNIKTWYSWKLLDKRWNIAKLTYKEKKGRN
jgi:hypothetical protein